MKVQVDSNSSMSTHASCKHCSEPVITPFQDNQGHHFCCAGCLQVYSIIHHHHLDYFYTIQRETGDYTKPQTHKTNYKYDYLDQEQAHLKYTFATDEGLETSFYLEGIHCTACLWLIEQLPSFSNDIVRCRLDIEKSVVTILLKKDASLSKVATTLNQLGYRPFPIEGEQERQKRSREEERTTLLRLGVALACSMNIMLYSLGIYAGAGGHYSSVFNVLSLLLCLPVFFYSAWPFYTSAFYALKNKRVNLDVPLSFSIVVGFILSSYHIAIGSNVHYLDSISVLVFLILLSRYALKKVQQNSLTSTDLSMIFGTGRVLRVPSAKLEDSHNHEEIELSSVLLQDYLLVLPGEKVPCDGVIVGGSSRVNTSLLTGESGLIKVSPNHVVKQGYLNQDHDLIVRCDALPHHSDLAKMIKEAQKELKNKPSLLLLTDRLSQNFISIVFVTFFLTLAFGSHYYGLEEALSRSLALVIVACPCALGLATPLAFSRALRKAAKLGIMIKNEETIEKLAHARHLYFDKTGTLTKGHFQVSAFTTHQKPSINYSLEDITFSLEKDNVHPIARALLTYLGRHHKQLKEVPWEQPNQQLDHGICNFYQGFTYKIAATSTHDHHLILELKENERVLATFSLTDQLRESTPQTAAWLFQQGYRMSILSGDQQHRVDHLQQNIGPYFDLVLGQQNPQQKAKEIAQKTNTVMIGDGANDSLAFSKSTISIAVQGALESSLKIADVYLSRAGLIPIKHLMILSSDTIRLIKRNLAISLIYNILGATFALMGLIGPLEAAILMPLSSFTVLISTLLSTSRIRKLPGVLHGSP